MKIVKILRFFLNLYIFFEILVGVLNNFIYRGIGNNNLGYSILRDIIRVYWDL